MLQSLRKAIWWRLIGRPVLKEAEERQRAHRAKYADVFAAIEAEDRARSQAG